MPKKALLCFNEGKVGGRAPVQLRTPMCVGCTKLWDEERFDRTREKKYYHGFPCTGPPAPAAVCSPATPASPVVARQRAEPRRFADSPM